MVEVLREYNKKYPDAWVTVSTIAKKIGIKYRDAYRYAQFLYFLSTLPKIEIERRTYGEKETFVLRLSPKTLEEVLI
jgi:hypothetical protein